MKKDARRVAAELPLKPSSAAGRRVADLLTAWLDITTIALWLGHSSTALRRR